MPTYNGTSGGDAIYGDQGGAAEDIVNGLEGYDYLSGGELADILDGGDGNDELYGGAGDDLLKGGSGDDLLDGGQGIDTVTYEGRFPGVSVSLMIGGDQSTGGGVDRLIGIENIIGTLYSDNISGDDKDNIINGLYGGNDELNGLGGNDWLLSAGGEDILNGGSGDDRVDIGIIQTWYGGSVDGGDGFDILNFVVDDNRLPHFSGDVGSIFRGFEAVSGEFYGQNQDDFLDLRQLTSKSRIPGHLTIQAALGNDTILGGNEDDSILGNSGNDVLNGGGGDDILSGGDGDDTLVGGMDNDELRGDAGVDTVDYSGVAVAIFVNLATNSASGGTGVDRLYDVERVVGTRFSDMLSGDGGNNILIGGVGNDLLAGGLGDDRLEGGAGIDVADYNGAAAGVVVNLQTGATSGGADNDMLVEIENVVGTRFSDVLIGNAGANSLQGGLGDDVLSGGAGEDLLDGGGNTDLASYADAASAVTVNLRLATRQNTLGAGVDTLVGIENLEGSAYNDTLVGNGGANVLTGGAGIDTADYAGAASAVRVSLAVAGRQNTLGDGVDTLAGIENLNGTGFDDQLTGDAGNNRLTGNNGNDLLVGGLGDDFLSGGAGTDTVSYAGLTSGVTVHLGITAAQDTVAGGVDTLISIETLVGTSYADKLTGNAFANSISGGNGDDVIDAGGGGAGYGDTLDGGLGNDSIKGGGGVDIIIGGAGTDLMTGGVSNDRFVFNAATDSRVGRTLTDRITDFASGDILDLSGIDANAGTTGSNEAFIQVAAFTKAAGELTLAFDAATNTTTLNADTTGDGIADFSVLFTGNVAPAITANWVL